MTEFTIVGNLKSVNEHGNSFILKEGKNEYLVYATSESGLADELREIRKNSRLKITGIITKDNVTGENVFICNKATVMLGKDIKNAVKN